MAPSTGAFPYLSRFFHSSSSLASSSFPPSLYILLLKVGRGKEGRYILGRLRGASGEDFGKAGAEFQDIRNVAELEGKTASSTTYWSMFTGRGSGKLHTGLRVQLVIWLQIMQDWI